MIVLSTGDGKKWLAEQPELDRNMIREYAYQLMSIFDPKTKKWEMPSGDDSASVNEDYWQCEMYLKALYYCEIEHGVKFPRSFFTLGLPNGSTEDMRKRLEREEEHNA